MNTKKLSSEQLERLEVMKKELAELKLKTQEKLLMLESISANKLYCN